jgi:hypothetical protein
MHATGISGLSRLIGGIRIPFGRGASGNYLERQMIKLFGVGSMMSDARRFAFSDLWLLAFFLCY